MRTMLAGVALVGALLFVLGGAVGGEKGKEVTLKGKITCAKCDLGTATACQTVIVFKDGGKEIVLPFDTASHKQHHSKVCSAPIEGSVTGVISGKGDKKTIAVKELKTN